MDPRTAVRARLLMGAGLGLVTAVTDLSFVLAHLAGPTLVTAGLHVGVASLAVYGVAYRAMERALGGGNGRAVAWAGMLGGALGAAIHAVTGVVILDRLAMEPRVVIAASTLTHVPTVLAPLWALTLLVTLAGSIVFAVAVLRGQTQFPRWVGLANPALVSAVVWGAGAMTPWGDVVAAVAVNVGQLVFFSVLATLYRPSRAQPETPSP